MTDDPLLAAIRAAKAGEQPGPAQPERPAVEPHEHQWAWAGRERYDTFGYVSVERCIVLGCEEERAEPRVRIGEDLP
jgi:hypothetical protein